MVVAPQIGWWMHIGCMLAVARPRILWHRGASRLTIGVEPSARVKISSKKPGFDFQEHLLPQKRPRGMEAHRRAQAQIPLLRRVASCVANTPGVREYMAIGVVKDEEIGEMSEIKEVAYAG